MDTNSIINNLKTKRDALKWCLRNNDYNNNIKNSFEEEINNLDLQIKEAFNYINESIRRQSIKRHEYLDREYIDLELDIMERPDLYARFPELQEYYDEDYYYYN